MATHVPLFRLSFFLLTLVTVFAVDLNIVPEASPPHHHHHHHHASSPSPSPVHPPHHHHYTHPPSHSPVHPPVHSPVHPPSHHHHHGHPPSPAPVHPPSHHHHHGHPPSPAPVHPPSHHHHHGHPPSPAPVHPPTYHHHPVHAPVSPPTYHHPGHPPVHPPSVAPSHPPSFHFPRSFVAIQGVVYCKSCNYSGVDTLNGASPLPGAYVRLECNNTKTTLFEKAKTDKNGYFFIEAPKPLTTYGAHKCKVSLYSSPLFLCNKPSDLHGGSKGSILRTVKSYKSKNLPFVLYSVGPFAFEPPKCVH